MEIVLNEYVIINVGKNDMNIANKAVEMSLLRIIAGKLNRIEKPTKTLEK